MRIDKEKLAGIVAMPDEELWEMICSVARSHGIRLPEKCPPHAELEKVRMALPMEQARMWQRRYGW